jgi:antitoxin ParD1/3/4
VFATASAGVAAAIERLIQDEEARLAMVDALADEVRARAATPAADYMDEEAAFGPAFDALRKA